MHMSKHLMGQRLKFRRRNQTSPKRRRGIATHDYLKSLFLDRSGWWVLWYRGWTRTVVDLVCLAGCSIASDILGPLVVFSFLSMPMGAMPVP